jgi:hypothetical protein
MTVRNKAEIVFNRAERGQISKIEGLAITTMAKTRNRANKGNSERF